MSRAISDKFIHDLKEGRLASLTRKVQNDDTLMLALRGKSINIYYRGGSIVRLEESGDRYFPFFDMNYTKGNAIPPPPQFISTEAHCLEWVDAFPMLKESMNGFFSKNRKSEREFQQLVAWENNRSPIANETEYFFTDIEFADSELGARVDMVGLKWKASERRDGIRCTPVLVEMKYGIGALDGQSGITKHVDDLNALLGREDKQAALNKMIGDQFLQLNKLELFRLKKKVPSDGIEVSGKPEVVLLIANNNPRSKKLLQVLENIEEPQHYNLRFFVASFAGYGMHEACMLSLSEFCQHLERMPKSVG